MKLSDIPFIRLRNQLISDRRFSKPEEVVRHLGAMQAQDYLGALWAVGLRMKTAVEADIENALAKRKIVRTWPMRGTLHFVASEDAHWMIDLMSPGVSRAAALRGEKNFGLTEVLMKKCRKIVEKKLTGGKSAGRPELYEALEENGITTKNSRGLHILGRLALQKLICFGPRRGKEHVFVLFDEWIPRRKNITRTEALRRIAVTYFTGHGPAQIQDLGWWSGLPLKDIRQGITAAAGELKSIYIDGKMYFMSAETGNASLDETAHLLPPFDEYVIGYKDRNAVLEAVHARHVNPGANGMFSPIVVLRGQVAGIWKRSIRKNLVTISTTPFAGFSNSELQRISKAETAYKNFIK